MCHMEINAMLEIKASNIVFNETFLLRSGTKQRCPLTPLFLNTVLKFLAYAIRKRKKDTQIGKEEIKLSLFADDTVIYTDILKDVTKKTELISNYSKVAGYIIN